RLSADRQRTTGDRKRTGVASFPLVADRRITDLNPQTTDVTRGQGSGLKPILAQIGVSTTFLQT
ncbi:hypothetical protein HAX54_012506, partial [Datura stramonium]|nr:hypothetical protein [Datura stramonium]